MHSANFELMPRKPATTIQKTAPGPPTPTANATPAMLPSPTVAESAADSAWKCDDVAGVVRGALYWPRTQAIGVAEARGS